MSNRRRWVAVALAVVIAAAGGGGYVVYSTHTSTRHSHPAARQPTARSPVLAALSPSAPLPTGTQVAHVLAAGVRAPAFGGHLAGLVVDAATGTVLFDRQSRTPMPPASTAKILTAIAALTSLGPEAALHTDVRRVGTTLYLVGGGDVTLRDRAPSSYPMTAALAELAAKTAAALPPTVTRWRLCYDATAWTGPPRAPGWSPSYVNDGDIAPLSALEVDEGEITPGKAPRVVNPAAQAALAFARDLHARNVAAAVSSCSGSAPSTAVSVAAVQSAPVAALVQRMLTVSDNDLAEALGRAVARHDAASADFAGEALAITDDLARSGIAGGLRLYDASGLSRLDRISPRVLVAALRLAMSPSHPQLRPVLEGLPVAALTGTLADRYRRGASASAAGLARAKTGTLVGVNTLAGYVTDTSGRLLVFAFMTDHAVSPDTAEPALDRLAGALARL